MLLVKFAKTIPKYFPSFLKYLPTYTSKINKLCFLLLLFNLFEPGLKLKLAKNYDSELKQMQCSRLPRSHNKKKINDVELIRNTSYNSGYGSVMENLVLR